MKGFPASSSSSLIFLRALVGLLLWAIVSSSSACQSQPQGASTTEVVRVTQFVDVTRIVRIKRVTPIIRVVTNTPRAPISITLSVPAAGGWQDTGILLPLDSRVNVAYVSGRWSLGGGLGFADAQGYPDFYPASLGGACNDAPMPDEQAGALIARIGEGQAFVVGNSVALASDRDAVLFLGPNDAEACLGDNQGKVTVEILIISR
jgi:hypothetical protein